jgi:hypothetical protein
MIQYKAQPEAAYRCSEPTTKVRFSFSLERFATIEPARQIQAPAHAASIASFWIQGPSFKSCPQVIQEKSAQYARRPAIAPVFRSVPRGLHPAQPAARGVHLANSNPKGDSVAP